MPQPKKEAPPAVNFAKQEEETIQATEIEKELSQQLQVPDPAVNVTPTPTTIRLEMDLLIIRPDTREFRQNSAELQPRGFGVAIDVPIELFAISNGEKPMLTPAGLVYLQKQLELPYQEWQIQTVNKQQPPADDLPWEEKDEVKPTEKKSKSAPTEDDEWETETKTETESKKSTQKDEENWDEDWS